jgi:hypothetical protein
MKGGGRGYYRPTSLLSVWAFAPFMHNDAIGPEICGKPADATIDFYVSPYVTRDGKPVQNPPGCWTFDPSVEGRWRLYKASMEDLLNPKMRIPKMLLTYEDIVVDVAPKIKIGNNETGLSLRIPKGRPVVLLNSLRFKDLVQDIILVDSNPAKLEAKYKELITAERLRALRDGLMKLRAYLLAQRGHVTLDLTQELGDFVQSYYSNVLGRIENDGHTFGENLSDHEKQALIAFLATL